VPARRPDPIRVVEAGYAWNADEAAWLDGLVASCQRYEVGGGVIGYTLRAGAKSTEVMTTRGNADDDVTNRMGDALSSLPPSVALSVMAPTEFVGNCKYRLARLGRTSAKPVADAATKTMNRIPDAWALVCGDIHSRALMVCFPRRGVGSPDEPFPHADSRALGLAGAHLGAALRLRELARPVATDDAETEAVMSPAGKVLHATGAATNERMRESLTLAVRASERARKRTRVMAQDDALREWTALVNGRWTILETIESDGKRYVLARRNPLRRPALLDLTADERDVTWLAAHGHSYKYIAYELGIPLSTVAGRLRRAMQKLRIESRADLLRKLGTGT
jgi:DNA-binding CsgD family transcriptional regulator